jgi:hypothetical protein
MAATTESRCRKPLSPQVGAAQYSLGRDSQVDFGKYLSINHGFTVDMYEEASPLPAG